MGKQKKAPLIVTIFGCRKCGMKTSTPTRDGYGEIYCPECDSCDMYATDERPARWVSVAVYTIYRQYGGPEEGGWYYDEGMLSEEHIEQTLVTKDVAAGLAHTRALNDSLAKEVRARCHIEQMPPDSWPETRPRYC